MEVMMDHRSIEAYINGIMMKNLRIEAGYSLEQVYKMTQIKKDTLIKIEQGASMEGIDCLLALYQIDTERFQEWERINYEILHHLEYCLFTLKEASFLKQHEQKKKLLFDLKLLRLPLSLVEKEEINPDVIEINQEVLEQGEEEIVKFLKAINYLKECFQEKHLVS